jgi:hypothetical protein
MPDRRKRRVPPKGEVRGYLAVNKLMNRAIGKVLTLARGRDKNAAARVNNREAIADGKRKCYFAKHSEYRAKQTEYRRNHLIEESVRHSAYFQANKRELTDKHLEYKKERRQTDSAFRLNERCHNRLKTWLKAKHNGRKCKTFDIVGLSVSELWTKLKQDAQVDSLEDYDIDHIFPVSRYSAGQEERMMNHSNLQLLPKAANSWKKARLPTKAMAAKVDRSCWPDGVTEDMLPDIYPDWSSPLRM